VKQITFYKTAAGNCPVQEYGSTKERISEAEVVAMDDLDKYVSKRKKRSPAFSRGLETGYEEFKIGVMLRMAREEAGITQKELAFRLRTKKSAISRIENHAEDIRLSTLEKVAEAIGKRLTLKIA